MKKIKSIIATLLTASILTAQTFAVNVYDHENAENVIVTPSWDNANSVTCSLYFSSGIGYVNSNIVGRDGTTSISGTVTVYRRGFLRWIYITSWSDSVEGNFLSLSDSFTAENGKKYKIELEADVVCGGITESVTAEDEATCQD